VELRGPQPRRDRPVPRRMAGGIGPLRAGRGIPGPIATPARSADAERSSQAPAHATGSPRSQRMGI